MNKRPLNDLLIGLREKERFHRLCATQHIIPEQIMASLIKADVIREIAEELEKVVL